MASREKCEWFINRLSYYKVESRDSIEIMDYLKNLNISDAQVEDLWYCLRANYEYKTVPSIGYINKILNEFVIRGTEKPRAVDRYTDMVMNNNAIEDSWNSWELKPILVKLIEIRKRDTSEWSFTDKCFWAKFDEIYNEFSECKAIGYEPSALKGHLDYVFNAIRRGEFYKSVCNRTVEVDEDRTGLQSFSSAIPVGG